MTIRGANGDRTLVGEIPVAEQKARHFEVMRERPMVCRCGVAGCDWTFEGTAAEGIDAHRTHRAEAHPDIKPRTRKTGKFSLKPKPVEPPVEPAAALGVGSEAPGGSTGSGAKKRGRKFGGGRWNRASIIEAIQTWARDHDGRPPSSHDWSSSNGGTTPTKSAVQRHFESWGDAVVAAGFPRPQRGYWGRRSAPGRAGATTTRRIDDSAATVEQPQARPAADQIPTHDSPPASDGEGDGTPTAVALADLDLNELAIVAGVVSTVGRFLGAAEPSARRDLWATAVHLIEGALP